MGRSLMFSWEEEEVVAVWRIKTLGTFSNNDTSQPPSQPATHFSLSWELLKLNVNKYFSVLFQAFMSRRRKTKHYFTSSKYFQCWDSTSTSISCVYQKQYFILILYISPYPPFDLRNKCLLGKFEGNLNKTQKLHIGGWIFNGKKYESFGWTE